MKQDAINHIQSVISNQGLDEAEMMQQIKHLVYEFETKDKLLNSSNKCNFTG